MNAEAAIISTSQIQPPTRLVHMCLVGNSTLFWGQKAGNSAESVLRPSANRRLGCDRQPPASLKEGGEISSHRSAAGDAGRNPPAISQPRGEQPRTAVFLKLEFLSD